MTDTAPPMTRATARDGTELEGDEALIARYIEEDPNGMGRHRARVIVGEASIPIWVLAGYIRYGGTVTQAAADYALPEEAVSASLAFYARHRSVIDAWLTLNEESFNPAASRRGRLPFRRGGRGADDLRPGRAWP